MRYGKMLAVVAMLATLALIGAAGTGLISSDSPAGDAFEGVSVRTDALGTSQNLITGGYAHHMLEPLAKVLAYPDDVVIVAIVRPTTRQADSLSLTTDMTGDAYPRGSDTLAAQGYTRYPLTAVTVETIEILKGSLPHTFTVWENRGVVDGLQIDSADPYLAPETQGLLIAGHPNGDRLTPLVYCPVDEDGYLADPYLDMPLDELRAMIDAA